MTTSVLPRSVPAVAVEPARLADLLLAALVHADLVSASLVPGANVASLELEYGSGQLDEFVVAPDVAMAACVRLALAARLDLLAEAGSAEAAANVTRMPVRTGDERAEVLVSLTARRDGLEIELQRLDPKGRPMPVRRQVALRRCQTCRAYQPWPALRCPADGTELVDVAEKPEAGGTIGHYRLDRVVGQGGDGLVFAGEHAVIGRPVAVKLLHRSFAEEPLAARRFLAEARAVSRLRHDNVVEVTDFGLLADRRPYIVMELLVGRSLHLLMEDEGPLAIPRALLLTRAIAEGLGAAHAAGIVHNDLKPSNVLVLDEADPQRPRLKILDFGAASARGERQVTPEGEVFGTPYYMAPEHTRGLPTDQRSDLYSLGVVLYEMLDGEVPFGGDDPAVVARAHAFSAVRPVDRLDGPLPPAVGKLLTRCLRKSPEERPQTATELVAALDEALESLGRPAWARWMP